MDDAASRFSIVGIGASAGGVDALKTFFHAIEGTPRDIAFVVVTHLGPGHESALPAILGDCTSMPVLPARDGEALRPGHAYVLATDAIITLAAGRFCLRPQEPAAHRLRQPIDVFLASLAVDQGDWAIGIVLSGTGSDGTLGLKAIKENGGFTLAQGTLGDEPRYPEMPASAVASGAVDLVLPVEDMPARLAPLARQLDVAAAGNEPADLVERTGNAQHEIAALIRTRIGHDFAGYKSMTFLRRVRRRIQVLQLPNLAAYVERLQADPEETGKLFRDLLIGVTGFFRDGEAFALLEQRVIPALFEGKQPGDEIRVWVPGCATGEEAYSLAMLLRERLAARPCGARIRIFATDIDETALSVARLGRYPAPLLAGLSPERLERHFTRDGAVFVVAPEVRELCIFSPHSVIRDPPFSRVDLISCRNLLIYLGGRLQDQVLPLFHYALRPGGFLFLGVSETVARHTAYFTPEDKAHRIYRRRDHVEARPALPPLLPGTARQWRPVGSLQPSPVAAAAALRLAAERLVLEEFAPAHVVVNRDGEVIHQSARLGKYLEPAPGQPTRQILAMARRGLRLELRTALHKAAETGARVVRPRIIIEVDDRKHAISLTVTPLPAGPTEEMRRPMPAPAGAPAADAARALQPGIPPAAPTGDPAPPARDGQPASPHDDQATPPPSGQAAASPAARAAPPTAGDATPPRVDEAALPRAGQAAPPRMAQPAAPLGTRQAAPPGGPAEPLFLVVFTDLGPPLSPEVGAARRTEDAAVGLLERELRETRERLQSTVEEYETVNEELKSANEEMVTVNEELQSSNEELETSKEELQSVNEELRSVNLQLTAKVDALAQANADIKNLFESTQVGTVFLDRSLAVRSFTPAATAIFNLMPADRGRPLTDFASQLDRVDLQTEINLVLKQGEPLELRVNTRDGAHHYLMRLLPYRTASGEIDGVILTFLDVTKVVEGEILGTLVDELNHRVRNMLQVVLSVAAHTARGATSVEQFTRSFTGRIRALGRSHELVARGNWSDVPLKDLVLRELRPYASGDDRFTVSGPPQALNPKAALALGMIVHELATNAAKHGALSAAQGRVAVAWTVEGASRAAQLVLHWTETGGPAVPGSPSRRGFGSELIERQLRHDLDGDVAMEFAPEGLRATLTMALDLAGAKRRRDLPPPVRRATLPPGDVLRH